MYFIAEPHLKECFFVAFLKFPPIVQSGSILFRKLDRERRGKDASPYLRLPAIGCDVHLWLMTSLPCRQKILQLFGEGGKKAVKCSYQMKVRAV